MVIIDILYFFILIILLPFTPKYLIKREYRQVLKKRLSPDILNKKVKKRIWLHAVSVGEVKSLKKMISEIIEFTDYEIILSVTTPSGYKVAKNEFKSIIIIPAPLDFSFTIKKFIKTIKPDILILNELELWPNWLIITKRFNIPILLINGRMSTNAMKKYKRFKTIIKLFLNKIDLIILQANIYKNRFIELGLNPKKIIICGNIKADEALNAKENLPTKESIIDYLKVKKNNQKIITFASTHKSDEEIFIPAILSLKDQYTFIIVPRHIERVPEIAESLDSFNIKFNIWSKSDNINLAKSVLIFDKIGYLFNIHYISDLIVMGGTFSEKIGGHNLFEPAVLGKRIIGGKYYNNFPDIGKDLQNLSAYIKVKDSNEMVETIKNISKDFNSKRITDSARQEVLKRQGSVECIIKEINKIL